jgi:hypothetical protein
VGGYHYTKRRDGEVRQEDDLTTLESSLQEARDEEGKQQSELEPKRPPFPSAAAHNKLLEVI